MKIRQAWQDYSAQLDALRERRKTISNMLKDPALAAAPDYDRVELTRELSGVDAQIDAVFNGRENIIAAWGAIADAESARQQGEAAAGAAKELGKILEVYRRIASGAKVPAKDEQKLMEYDFKLYMAAKQAAALAKANDEEYDSLWEDEEENSGEQASPTEVADSAEIAVPSPEAVAAQAAAGDMAEA